MVTLPLVSIFLEYAKDKSNDICPLGVIMNADGTPVMKLTLPIHLGVAKMNHWPCESLKRKP